MIASETRCLPSTSAIRTAHEHNHEPSESRSRSPTSRVQLALDLEETSWRGWGPVRLVDDSFQGASRLPPPPELRCRSANEDFHPTPAEVSRTRGLRARERACRRSPPGEACRERCSRQGIVRCAGMRTSKGAFPKLDPLEHLLSRYRFDLGWRARDHRSYVAPKRGDDPSDSASQT